MTAIPDSASISPPTRVLVAITALATIAASVWFGLGVLSLPGLALLAASGVAIVVLRPAWLVVITPALMFVPGRRTVFFHEFALLLLAYVVVLHGLRHRARWLVTLDKVERVNLIFVGWALITGFWSGDVHFYLHGVRRLMVGVLSFWVAYRLPNMVRRRTFEIGLTAGALALAGSALAKSVASTGFGQKAVSRGEETDLGWGKANYIAAMLLVLGPPILDMAFRARSVALRALAWVASALNLFLQVLIASRAAAVLYFGGLFAQLTGGRRRGRWVIALTVAVVTTVALVSPGGQKLLSRFTDLRELSGMVIRIWYWREAWHRSGEGFPFGIGLNQGYVHPDKLGSMGTHDYWLDLSSELGVLGVVLWFGFLVGVFNRLRQIGKTPGWAWEGRALMIAFWLSQLHTLVEPTFQGLHFQFVYFWVFGGYLGYHALGATREAEAARDALVTARDEAPSHPRAEPPTPRPQSA